MISVAPPFLDPSILGFFKGHVLLCTVVNHYETHHLEEYVYFFQTSNKQIQAYVFDLLELQMVQISENLRGPRWLEPEEMNQLSRDLTSDQPQNRR